MQTKQKKAVANTSFGKAHPPLPFSYEWQVYDTTDEMVAAKDEMTLEERRKARNTEKQNNARGKALKAAQDAAGIVKPTAENDEQVRLKDVYKTLLTAKVNGQPKYTDEQAREVASTVTGVSWEDDED
jgi:hypothetical protein